VPAGFGLSGKKEDDLSYFFLFVVLEFRCPFCNIVPNSTLLRVKELAGLDKISTCELETPPLSLSIIVIKLR